MRIEDVEEVSMLCADVKALAHKVRADAKAQERADLNWDLDGDHRLTAALKRRSMDLTRALARLRGRARA